MTQQRLQTGAEEYFSGQDPTDVSRFQFLIRSFYEVHRRPMPWRDLISPYSVLISEIMLQQTQVPRVMEKFPAFLERFPDFQTLASASLAEILLAWQGLGYNRRARYLKLTAETIVARFSGVLPDDPDLLTTLPGIGKATAGAVVAYAYNRPVVFIETNIRRTFIHHFFPGRDIVHDTDIFPLVSLTLDRENPREWYYALMDYGTWLAGQVENPNKRSHHYSRQSPFKGSDREIRGMILRALLRDEMLPYQELITLVGPDTDRIQAIIHRMVQEKILGIENGCVLISRKESN